MSEVRYMTDAKSEREKWTLQRRLRATTVIGALLTPMVVGGVFGYEWAMHEEHRSNTADAVQAAAYERCLPEVQRLSTQGNTFSKASDIPTKVQEDCGLTYAISVARSDFETVVQDADQNLPLDAHMTGGQLDPIIELPSPVTLQGEINRLERQGSSTGIGAPVGDAVLGAAIGFVGAGLFAARRHIVKDIGELLQ